MKKFFEKLFDLLYDYIDYIIMIAIIVIVVAIIGWRLDIIFTDNGTSSKPPTEVIEDENEEDPLDDPEETDPEESDDSSDETEEPESEEPEESEDEVGSEVEIEIPSGTLPTGIASILLDHHLIEDNDAFLSVVQEQDLETGLKAGVYIIPSGSSIDEILEILTN